MFGDHGLGGLLEEGTHEKSPKCLGGNLGDFGEFCKGLIIFVLVFGRLQASGTLNFPDRLYPIWKWAVGAGMLYAAIGTMLGYAFSGSFSLVSFLLIIVLSSIWFSLYFKLLRLTASKTVLNQCIYWVLGIVSALLLPFVVGYLSLLVKGFMQ